MKSTVFQVLLPSLSMLAICFAPPSVAQDGCGQFDCGGSGSGPCSGVVIEITDINCDATDCTIEVEVSNTSGNPTSKTFRRSGSGNQSITLCNRGDPPCCVHIEPCVSWSDTDNNCCINRECE